MTDEIRLSVALVTCGRPDRLERALASLRAQDVQPWEVVVSDDSAPAEVEATRSVAERHGCRYVPGPRRGLYANRNAAALACRGTHIRTMDDDHELPPGHLRACLASLAEDPGAVWVLGEWVPEEWGPEVGRVPGPGELHPRGFAVQPRDPSRSAAIADGATIYPRRVFDEGARYADAFTFGIVFLEFGDRLAHLGYRIRHLDSTYVLHHATPSSIEDEGTETAARVYAVLCHSFLYRPTARNRVLTLLELGRLSLRGPSSWRSIRRGLDAYRLRRAETATA